jgi:hypothetical protein
MIMDINIKNKIIKYLSKNILAENLKYKNIYKDEECYLIGNGISLKWFDLKKFANKKSLVCNWMYLHNQFKYLNVVGDCATHPFLFYPFLTNPGDNKFGVNKIGKYMIESGKLDDRNYPVFSSISNYPVLKKYNNIAYLHRFDYLNDLNKIDMSGIFSLMSGSLEVLLGSAIYMGFKKINLVGMDRIFAPPYGPHFYEKGTQKIGRYDYDFRVKRYQSLFSDIEKLHNLEIRAILPSWGEYKSGKFIYYNELFECQEKYRENHDLVNPMKLKKLNDLGLRYSV